MVRLAGALEVFESLFEGIRWDPRRENLVITDPPELPRVSSRRKATTTVLAAEAEAR